jgi:hypothetical protein
MLKNAILALALTGWMSGCTTEETVTTNSVNKPIDSTITTVSDTMKWGDTLICFKKDTIINDTSCSITFVRNAHKKVLGGQWFQVYMGGKVTTQARAGFVTQLNDSMAQWFVPDDVFARMLSVDTNTIIPKGNYNVLKKN